MFDGATVEDAVVNVEEFGHPKSFDATVQGVVDRAKQAYVGHDYGFGIEKGGLMEVPQTTSGYLEAAACAIYDGEQIQ